MRVFTSKGEQIELEDKPFASGGEGAVYKVMFAPHYFRNMCVKVYHIKSERSNNDWIKLKKREDKIKYMVQNPPPVTCKDGFMLAWPKDWITDRQGVFLGYVMPMSFPDSIELVNLTAKDLRKKYDKGWHDRYDRSLGKKALLSRLKLICNIALPVHIIHSTGKYVLQDFKPQNVLVTKEGRVTLVDMDSIQISEGNRLLYPGTAATPDYRPPEYYKLRGNHIINPSWDMFAVGVVFYQLLLGIHPYTVTPKTQQADGSNTEAQNIASNLFPFGPNSYLVAVRPKDQDRFDLLPKNIRDMFLRTFTDNMNNRPTAESWGKLIYKIVTDAEKTINGSRIEPTIVQENISNITKKNTSTHVVEKDNRSSQKDKKRRKGFIDDIKAIISVSIIFGILGLISCFQGEGLIAIIIGLGMGVLFGVLMCIFARLG